MSVFALRIQAHAAIGLPQNPQFGRGNHVDQGVVLIQSDVAALTHLFNQSLLHGSPCRIGGVNDAPCAVPTFAGKV